PAARDEAPACRQDGRARARSEGRGTRDATALRSVRLRRRARTLGGRRREGREKTEGRVRRQGQGVRREEEGERAYGDDCGAARARHGCGHRSRDEPHAAERKAGEYPAPRAPWTHLEGDFAGSGRRQLPAETG